MTLPDALRRVLQGAGLLDPPRSPVPPGTEPALEPAVESLTGGVSSEVLVVHTTPDPVCAKRALSQLRVAGRWEAPVERSISEARWLQTAAQLVPGLAPPLLASGEGWLVMPYLPPERWSTFKGLLLAGQGDPELVAQRLGAALGQLHERAAAQPELAARFDTTEDFGALRLEPYLRTLASRYPEHAEAQRDLEDSLLANRRTLVHGDVSPKNVLVDIESTPVLIDAECAWWGDAAFDLAFCLNHLLLKQLVVPEVAPVRRAARVFQGSYLAEIGFEPFEGIARRTARLLPWLLLARIDGLSPVEYLDASTQLRVRRTALMLLAQAHQEPDLDGLLSVVEERFND